MTWELIQGDCIQVMATRDAASVDAIVCDPPYGLGFMGRRWDALPPGVQWARECLRVLKPGGHLLAFGGTRTSHRLVCAIEDAGFEIRDTIVWLYGSGFPKSHNLKGDWDGWGTALKPAHEPIVVARKPLIGTVVANVLTYGTGSLNVNGCRIDGVPELRGRDAPGNLPNGNGTTHGAMERAPYAVPDGRWPANVVLDPEAAALLDAQTGERPSTGTPARTARPGLTQNGGYGDWAGAGIQGPLYSDTGGASRFFYCAKASTRERSAGLNGERNSHPTVKPLALMQWLVRLVTAPSGLVLDPFAGSGTTGVAALAEGMRFVGIESDPAYAQIARARIGAWQDETPPPLAQLDLLG